jgi:hypothetical protein
MKGGTTRDQPATQRGVTEDEVEAMLAAEADDVEERRERGDEGGPLHGTMPARQPSQVYTVRMPVHVLERLRRLAAAAGVTPSALMRAWVLERLELESSSQVVDERVRRAVRLELERAGLVNRP